MFDDTGEVDDFSFFDCSSPFGFLLIEFHCTFFHLLNTKGCILMTVSVFYLT